MAHAALHQAKLTGLLRGAGVSALEPLESPVGAANGSTDHTYVLLSDGAPLTSFGPVLAWATSQQIKTLTLICDSDAGHVARRAACFSGPTLMIGAWKIRESMAEPAQPVPVDAPPKLSEAVMIFAPVIEAAGARAVDDHGRLTAEVVGLEVARVTDDADHPPRLEVGVGQADRELHDYVHSGLSDADALARAVATVRPLRSAEAAAHPLNRVARQRWLREVLISRPELAGVDNLSPLAPLAPKGSLLGSEPAAAGTADGETIVVCSVGIDPELIPTAADYRYRQRQSDTAHPDAELVVVVPKRDLHPMTVRLAALLPRIRVVGVQPPWQ